MSWRNLGWCARRNNCFLTCSCQNSLSRWMCCFHISYSLLLRSKHVIIDILQVRLRIIDTITAIFSYRIGFSKSRIIASKYHCSVSLHPSHRTSFAGIPWAAHVRSWVPLAAKVAWTKSSLAAIAFLNFLRWSRCTSMHVKTILATVVSVSIWIGCKPLLILINLCIRIH